MQAGPLPGVLLPETLSVTVCLLPSRGSHSAPYRAKISGTVDTVNGPPPKKSSPVFLPGRAYTEKEETRTSNTGRWGNEKLLKRKGRFEWKRPLNEERLLKRSLSKDYLGIGLLSHVKVRSIMGDEALNFRVRNGIGCTRFSMDTKEIFQNI